MELLFRPRRLQQREPLRRMLQETHLRQRPHLPHVRRPGDRLRQEVPSMPRHGPPVAGPAGGRGQGRPGFRGAGGPPLRPAHQERRHRLRGRLPEGAVRQAVRSSRKSCPELVVITDVCLCGYTSTATAACSWGKKWTTTPPWRFWGRWRCPTPRPGPIWWRPPI